MIRTEAIQPLPLDLQPSPEDAPVNLDRQRINRRTIRVHWLEGGQVVRTTKENFQRIAELLRYGNPVSKADLMAMETAPEIWWSDQGRVSLTPPKSRGGGRLSIDQVREIRQSTASPPQLARDHGVTPTTIHRVLNRESYPGVS